MNTGKIRLLVADDQGTFRECIISRLKKESCLEVIDEAGNGNELVEKYFRIKPDVMLLGISMPLLTGTEALSEIRKQDKKARALFLSMLEGEKYLYAVIKAGGKGLLNKNTTVSEIVHAITIICGNKLYFPGWSECSIKEFIKEYEEKIPSAYFSKVELSDKEARVLRLIKRGYTSRKIDEMLNLSKRTIDAHRRNILSKLNIRSNAELFDYLIMMKPDI